MHAGHLSRYVDIYKPARINVELDIKKNKLFVSKFLVQLLQRLKILCNIGKSEKYDFNGHILGSWLNKHEVTTVKCRQGMHLVHKDFSSS